MMTNNFPRGQIFIRNARGDEFDVYAALVAEADALHHRHAPTPIKTAEYARPAERDFFACLQNPHYLLDVAVVPTATGQAVVGFIQANLIAREEDRAHTANRVVRIDLIVVTEALRRRGIGRKLIARVKTWAESMRADSVILDSYAFNIVAARLYEKSGFQVLKKTYMQTIS